jgi:hypothetical protein
MLVIFACFSINQKYGSIKWYRINSRDPPANNVIFALNSRKIIRKIRRMTMIKESCKLIVLGILLCACSVQQVTKSITVDPKLTEFLNSSNLVSSHDAFWVIELPESESALGTVYQKVTLDLDNKKYEAYKLASESIFEDAAVTKNVAEEKDTFSKDYSFTYNQAGDIALLSYFSGGVSDVNQIKKKVELTSVKKMKNTDFPVNRNYCNSNYYYVTRVWKGASSDFGLIQKTYKAKVAFISGGAAINGSEESSLHVIRQGIIALVLQPTEQLKGCPGQKAKGEIEIDLKKEMIARGFKIADNKKKGN